VVQSAASPPSVGTWSAGDDVLLEPLLGYAAVNLKRGLATHMEGLAFTQLVAEWSGHVQSLGSANPEPSMMTDEPMRLERTGSPGAMGPAL